MSDEEKRPVQAHGGRFGYGVIETTLMVIIIVILFFTAWFVHWSTDSTRSIINNTNSEAGTSAPQEPLAPSDVKTYAQCEQLPGSRIEQTYPQVCVTTDGKSFTDTGSSAGQ
jgi:hypothetical protein